MFQIPIKEFEKDIDVNISNEKKQEILELFRLSNKLRSKKEFDEIASKLREACKKCDIELIKIYLSETISFSNDFTFKIDETTKTASLFKVSKNISHLIIPRTIQHESTEYLITSIIGTDSDIKTINFSEDSAVKTIYSDAFACSTVNEINFPASLRELKEGWCNGTENLTKITISPSNGQFIIKDGKFLIGKSDSNKEEFDILLFALRDIEEISIPSDIKVISSYAFCNCKNLRNVEIPPNSDLQTIGLNAFSDTKIESIFIPSKVTKICEAAFYLSQNLSKVEFAPNSNLQTIEKFAFTSSNIEEIFIPSKVSEICEAAFFNCTNLSKFEFEPNSSLQKIESNIIAETKIEEILIPSNVSKICKEAFSICYNLRKVEIPSNSNLQTIEENAFSSSKIEEIYFPSNLRELNENWSNGANELRKIIISPSNDQFIFKDDKYLLGKTDPNSNEFDILLFVRHDIDEISIPSSVKIISSYLFCRCNNLRKVEIPPNSNLQIIGSFAFQETNIEEIFIPSKVSTISRYAFYECENLKKVEIPQNSNLKTIEENAFCLSKIEEIYFPSSLRELNKKWSNGANELRKIIISPSNDQFIFKDKYLLGKTDPNSNEFDILLFVRHDIDEISIPSNIKIISSHTFLCCHNLRKVEIPPNSNLQTIESFAFYDSSIEDIFIPSKVSEICEYAFNKCKNLRKFEIAPNSNLQTIGIRAFSESNIVSFCIPPKVSEIQYEAFCECSNLQIIEISEGLNLDLYQMTSLFKCCEPIIMIPSSYKK